MKLTHHQKTTIFAFIGLVFAILAVFFLVYQMIVWDEAVTATGPISSQIDHVEWGGANLAIFSSLILGYIALIIMSGFASEGVDT